MPELPLDGVADVLGAAFGGARREDHDEAGLGEHRKGPRALGGERLRRLFGRTVTGSLEWLRPLPPFSWLHARLRRSVEFSATDVSLSRGELETLDVAFVSDVHAGFYQTAEDLEALGERLTALAPDLVCLGGDLVATDPREMALFERFFRQLAPPLGTYAIPGNHECFYLERDLESWRRFLAGFGIRALLNEGVRLEHEGASLWLGGVDDFSEGIPDVGLALRGRRADEPAIVLSHHPDYVEHMAGHEVDLVLAGHTHGGQIAFGGWAPITHSKLGFRAGLYEHRGTQLFVGRGVGVSFLPVRIGSAPEIPILRLRRG